MRSSGDHLTRSSPSGQAGLLLLGVLGIRLGDRDIERLRSVDVEIGVANQNLLLLRSRRRQEIAPPCRTQSAPRSAMPAAAAKVDKQRT